MNWNNTPARYGLISIGLHWLTLALLAGVYTCINLTDLYANGSDGRQALKDWHFMLGLTVLTVVALRLLNRLFGSTPAVVPPLPSWQARLASTIHVCLYFFLAVMPILGWLSLSAAGQPIPFFGAQWPALLEQNNQLAEQLKEVHEAVGTLGYFLIGAHAVAALVHHFYVRDNTLLRILPRYHEK